MKTRLFSAVAVSAFAIATSANALFVDFTDTGVFPSPLSPVGGPVTVSVGGIDVTVTGVNGAGANQLNFDDTVTSPGAAFCTGGESGGPDFACLSDGAGIGGFNPDEVDGQEQLIVDFSETVEITAVYLLDFFSLSDADEEQANINFNNGSDLTVQPQNLFGVDNGYDPVTGLSQTTTRVVFTASDGNDTFGVGDFAVGGIEFNLVEDARIPVPAALPLLLSGIAGLALFRRRRAAAQA